MKSDKIEYRYNEGDFLDELQRYVDSTYSQHYVNKEIQVIDIWQSRGTLETTAADTAIKYIMRFGKKDGKNHKDLLKAMHYILLMMYASDNRKEQNETRTGATEPYNTDGGQGGGFSAQRSGLTARPSF
jgi:hypothetical protein